MAARLRRRGAMSRLSAKQHWRPPRAVAHSGHSRQRPLDTRAAFCNPPRVFMDVSFTIARLRACGALALIVLSSFALARAGAAQGTGVNVGVSFGLVRPQLGQRETEFWRGVGAFDTGTSADASLGYDWSQGGVSAEVHSARLSIGSRHATALGLAALGHWHPPVQWSGWSPTISAGYVRLALGGVAATQREIRADFLAPNGMMVGIPSEPQETTMLGNGFRLVAATDRALTPTVALRLFAGADVVSFGTVTYMHEDFTLRGAGWSTDLRIGTGLRFWPRGIGR